VEALRRTAAQGGHPVPRGADQQLSARVLGRHAPARRDRHRHGQRPRGHPGGRADDGTGRDRASPGPRFLEDGTVRDRGGAPAHHPRPRRHRRPRRSGPRDVRRPPGRGGNGRGHLLPAVHALHDRAVGLAAPARRRGSGAAAPDPRRAAVHSQDVCRETEPDLQVVESVTSASGQHRAACHFAEEVGRGDHGKIFSDGVVDNVVV